MKTNARSYVQAHGAVPKRSWIRTASFQLQGARHQQQQQVGQQHHLARTTIRDFKHLVRSCQEWALTGWPGENWRCGPASSPKFSTSQAPSAAAANSASCSPCVTVSRTKLGGSMRATSVNQVCPALHFKVDDPIHEQCDLAQPILRLVLRGIGQN